MILLALTLAGRSLLAQSPPPDADVRVDATVRAVRAVMPAVVNISTKTVVQRKGYVFDWWSRNWAQYVQEMPPQFSAGSGVIIDEEGYVLTNVHVVEEATEIEVKLSDERVVKAEVVIGTTRSDVALLKLHGRKGEKFNAARFAPDDDLMLGETVLALGNPFGLGGSVSRGILSALPRRRESAHGKLEMEDWLQTDAAINPGNSGGPLVNLRGEVIGLNVAIFREGQGIGFAVPNKRVGEAVSEIFTPEEIKSLWFGARFRSASNRFSVISLVAGSPAEKAGLAVGDHLLRVNNKVPRNLIDLNREIMAGGTSKDIVLLLERQGKQRSASVRLLPEKTFFNAELVRQKLGLTVQPLTPALGARLGFGDNIGLLIAGVDPNSAADKAGLEHGLLLEALNGRVLDDVTAAAKIVYSAAPGQTLQASVLIPRPLRRAAIVLKVQ